MQPVPDSFPHASLNAVANHRFANGTGESETDLWPISFAATRPKSRKQRSGKLAALLVYFAEFTGSQQADTSGKMPDKYYLSSLTLSLCRPFARRRESTARPSLVSMRVRNPCVFARRRLLG